MAEIVIDNNMLSLTGSVFNEPEKFRRVLHNLIYDQYRDEKLDKTYTVMLTNCPGGSIIDAYVFEGYLANIKREKPDVKFIAKCFGEIKSCATLLICSPVFDKVYIDKNSMWQIHSMKISITNEASFSIADLEKWIRRLKKSEDKMISYYTQRASLHVKTLSNWQKIIDEGDKTDLMTAQQFMDLGLCDGII